MESWWDVEPVRYAIGVECLAAVGGPLDLGCISTVLRRSSDRLLTVGLVPFGGPAGGILLAGEMLSLEAPAATRILETRVFCLVTPPVVRSLRVSFESSVARARDGAMALEVVKVIQW